MKREDFLIRRIAAVSATSVITPGSRIVITGATGWLGRTLVSLLSDSNFELYLVGSHKRNVNFSGIVRQVNVYDICEVREFQPTVLFDFAFVTREYREELGLAKYLQINDSLIDSALEIFSLPTIKFGLFTSSGAAVFPHLAKENDLENNPYGVLKQKTEFLAREAASRLGKRALVIRPWSLSGPLSSKVDSFAFSSFVLQSLSGTITVRSNRPVMRRYVSADDFLAVSILKLFSEDSIDSPFDSGGELISALNLAELIAEARGTPVTVYSDVNPGLEADEYFSDNTAWAAECERLNYVPETLKEQIQRNVMAVN